MSIQPLNPLTFPLYGERLIEASAGTGKTFTIGSLYLRLLLGLGDNDSRHAQPLTVDQILVVTFTVAATEELRDRIRERIHGMRIALQQEYYNDDALLLSLVDQISDKSVAIKRLIEAEQQMDEASIYTIHGFCQRILTQNAFESGSLFSKELVMDESQLKLHVAQDFWRKYFYPLSVTGLNSVLDVWPSPQALLLEIQYYLSSQAQIVSATMQGEDIESEIQERIRWIKKVKDVWKKEREKALNIKQLAIDSGGKLNGNKYRDKSIPNWVNEIDSWVEQTDSLKVPDNLYRFAQSRLDAAMSKGSVLSQERLFLEIENLAQQDLDIKPQLKAFAIAKMRSMLDRAKHKDQIMTFDDLLSRLAFALNSDEEQVLSSRIKAQYPIAMIDEFQDTDPLQYQIFSRIYAQQTQNRRAAGLFMIGDPKQAIYAFRGADVYTYMQARDQVVDHYNLDTNWRSSADMIASVNHLFSRTDKPFAETDIEFLPVKPRVGAEDQGWYRNKSKQAALTFCHPESQDLLSKNDYEHLMAQMTVTHIQQLLEESEAGSCYIRNGDKEQPIQPQDIAVLVRNGMQASKVKQLLAKQGIASVYLSNRDSVFAQDIALELYAILQSILMPEQEHYLRAANATKLFALTADELDRLNQDEVLWQNTVDEFIGYKEIWHKRGVMSCIRLLLQKRAMPEKLMERSDGERILTDILHIAELLQEVSRQLESENALLHWFNQRISEPNENAQAQQMRLESERNLVQIITIHKSKGLEYRFVFLPFACDFKEQKTALFHDEKKNLQLDLQDNSPMLEHADRERLAEDLRLIYVALTRAVYACFIGVSDIKIGNNKSSRLLDSALGYLLLKANNENNLIQQINLTTQDCAAIDAYTVNEEGIDHLYQPPEMMPPTLEMLTMSAEIEHDWYVTSYSSLMRQSAHRTQHLVVDELANFDRDAQSESNEEITVGTSIFDFPRGATPGTCLHSVFEQIDFNSNDEHATEIDIALRNAGIGIENEEGSLSIWQQTIEMLVEDVLSTALDGDKLYLNTITPAQRLAEMEFIFPIQKIAAPLINKHIAKYDPISAQAQPMDFSQISGMLKGFIDLIFCYQGRYYILDWKSNFLGSTQEDYSQEAMQQAMLEHRYDFQYQLYSVALHRYLASRIPDYDYEQHFGGVYYLFLRGIAPESDTGIFYTRPSLALIQGLDELMDNKH